jgi:hypothetical protein
VLVLAAVVLVLSVVAADDAQPSEADVLRSRGAAATGGPPLAGRRAAPGPALAQPRHQQPHWRAGRVQAAGASSSPGEISDGTSVVLTFWVF